MTQSSLFEVCKALLLSRTDKENGAAFKAHFNDWHHKADEFWVFGSICEWYPKGNKTERSGSCELHVCVIDQKRKSRNFTVIYEV